MTNLSHGLRADNRRVAASDDGGETRGTIPACLSRMRRSHAALITSVRAVQRVYAGNGHQEEQQKRSNNDTHLPSIVAICFTRFDRMIFDRMISPEHDRLNVAHRRAGSGTEVEETKGMIQTLNRGLRIGVMVFIAYGIIYRFPC
jgi:hypothetical protein